jgi:hypothetical protein
MQAVIDFLTIELNSGEDVVHESEIDFTKQIAG